MFWPHHEAGIQRWVEALSPDPDVLGIVVAGSLTKGFGKASSDIDGFIVLESEAYRKRAERDDLIFWSQDLCDYEGGYVDAKYIDLGFIDLVAERGSEPARSAFLGAQVRFSRVEDLEERCRRAARYPEEGREARIRRFWAQARFGEWLLGEAARKGNAYLAHHGAQKVALFAGRIVLAENRLLYPYHKWLLATLETVPDLPSGFVPGIEALVREATPDAAKPVIEALQAYRDWPVDAARWPNVFMRDSELNWLEHEPPVEDL